MTTFADIIYKGSFVQINNLCKLMTVVIDKLERNRKEFDCNLYTLLLSITTTSFFNGFICCYSCILIWILTKILIIDTDYIMFYRFVHSINLEMSIAVEN